MLPFSAHITSSPRCKRADETGAQSARPSLLYQVMGCESCGGFDSNECVMEYLEYSLLYKFEDFENGHKIINELFVGWNIV